MNSRACFRTLLAPTVLGLCTLVAGCDGKDDDETGISGATMTPDAETGAETADTTDPVPPGDVFNENFDAWEGGGDAFFTSKPENGDGVYPDHNTPATIGDQQAMTVHLNAEDNSGYGTAVEVQFLLAQQTNMSAEDYRVSFDIYVAAVTAAKDTYVQWAFFETVDFTPIYGAWSEILPADQWVHIESPVTVATVDYTTFTNSPADWILDAVRIQVIHGGDDAAIGDEMLFYIDNLVVTNTPAV